MPPMRVLGLLLATASLALLTAPSVAWSAGGGSVGEAASRPGDDQGAVRQLTDFLLYGGGGRAQREQAYVRRARAYLALGRDADALIDARAALALNPRDSEAIAVRDKAAAMATPVGPLAARPIGDASDALNAQILAKAQAVAARNRAAFAAHQAQEAQYAAATAAIAANTKAANDAYAAALAAHAAEVQALDQQHAAAMVDWEARVKACKAGDRTQCAKPPGKGS